jgi:hypothetical protein
MKKNMLNILDKINIWELFILDIIFGCNNYRYRFAAFPRLTSPGFFGATFANLRNGNILNESKGRFRVFPQLPCTYT